MLRQDKRKTLFKLIENSIGSNLFRNNYFFVDGKSKDLLENGDLSCAFYVSSILYLLKLIKDIHTTVQGTIKDMQESGWYEIKKPQKGAVILWDKNKKGHYHLGFYWDKNKAVSNVSPKKSPNFHPLNYQGRKILAFYYHKELEK
jgi:hypothetical protein